MCLEEKAIYFLVRVASSNYILVMNFEFASSSLCGYGVHSTLQDFISIAPIAIDTIMMQGSWLK